MRSKRLFALASLVVGLSCCGVLFLKTKKEVLPLPSSLPPYSSESDRIQFLDRYGSPLTTSYHNEWNMNELVPLHEIPRFLQEAFLEAEDQHFFLHSGVDWRARASAAAQNIFAGKVVRGASTISEQIVKMIHPRERSLWTRWIEGVEAVQLESEFSKAEIFECYLNQVPYAGNRRGVLQAARYYFSRDLDTLSRKEMLALAVLVRAPSRLDLNKDIVRVESPLIQLAKRLLNKRIISEQELAAIVEAKLEIKQDNLAIDAAHFVRYLRTYAPVRAGAVKIFTTLDGTLQSKGKALLEAQIAHLSQHHVSDGALVVLDHLDNQVLAWINAGNFYSNISGSQIDAITSPRQAGSTLKPFLYASALAKGWTASTLIDDSPVAHAIGLGLHQYRNYSRTHYGKIRLREALGNSLNIPAVRTVRFVGKKNFLRHLRDLEFDSLSQHPEYYGEGLALGGGEVSLLELVRAYSVFGRNGIKKPLKYYRDLREQDSKVSRIYSEEISTLTLDILSDPRARQLEFGQGNLLDFPVQTAVKTGTSSDYRDAWALGVSHRYTVGVWMGNLDAKSMQDVSGSIGPALVLRAIFAELERFGKSRPLYLSPRLLRRKICQETGDLVRNEMGQDPCASIDEWYLSDNLPKEAILTNVRDKETSNAIKEPIQLIKPTPGLHLARDPRIPDHLEAFPFVLSDSAMNDLDHVDWIVDNKVVATTKEAHYLWPLVAGRHRVKAIVSLVSTHNSIETAEVGFLVK